MAIIFEERSKEFHLYNDYVSYIIQILDNHTLGNLYYGKRIHHKEDFGYLLQGGYRPLAVYNAPGEHFLSPQYTKLEFPAYGTGDFRCPMIQITQQDGSNITNFEYESHSIIKGKKKLEGLPATYVEKEEEAETLEIVMRDKKLDVCCILSYTIFSWCPVIARSVQVKNEGNEKITLNRLLSASVDLPDADFEMIHLSGAWARERQIVRRKIEQGIQSVYSMRGTSSAEHNPFLALARSNCDEMQGEVYGFSFIYSGNHLEQVEVDTNDMTRISVGIHPDTFCWELLPGESFQSPEAVLVYSDSGLNGMSQTFHKLYRTRLVRGVWRDRERPVLINNWEATEMDFDEEKILGIAETARKLGVELFVLDDGWFGNREDDTSSLGDWYVKNFHKLPGGIKGLAEKIVKMGMKFGLWIEPEMVNFDSDLYREHPDWVLCAPGRRPSHSRNQYVLDLSREEVVNYLYHLLEKVLSGAPVSYVKWDMNRYLTECYSAAEQAEAQGKVFHKYILGVYRLYERLIERFPHILFESCSSGGARFDPGMLYYAPQTWTSDDTDAVERLKIQYGTSYVYPLCTMGAHVSACPNKQVGRVTPLETRSNVAMFGIFGYELDLNCLTEDEKRLVAEQIAFVKEHRQLIMTGTFYRLCSPFDGNSAAWMVVSDDRQEALVGYYRMRYTPNGPFTRLKLQGLDRDRAYQISGRAGCYFGDELIHTGLVIEDSDLCNSGGDFSSGVFYIQTVLG